MVAGFQSKYSWVSLGSSYLLSEILAAFLEQQLNHLDDIMKKRKVIWDEYSSCCQPFVRKGKIKVQSVPSYCETNYHGFYVVFETEEVRQKFINFMKSKEISPYIGYLPLHSSKMGKALGNDPRNLPITNKIADCIVRLPLYNSMTREEVEYVCANMSEFFKSL